MLSLAASAEELYLPDPVRTPGEINRNVRQDNLSETVCVAGYTEMIRPNTKYTGKLRKKLFKEWGLRGKVADYRLDHLVPLCAGGHPYDVKNLWMQPAEAQWSDKAKNQLEGSVCRAICNGSMTLCEGQVLSWRLLTGRRVTNSSSVSSGVENPTARFGIPSRDDRETREDRERYDALDDQDSAGRAQRVSAERSGFRANKVGVEASQRIDWRLLWREPLAHARIPSRVDHLRWPLPWHGDGRKFFPQHLLRSLGPSRAARIGVQVIERNPMRRSPAALRTAPLTRLTQLGYGTLRCWHVEPFSMVLARLEGSKESREALGPRDAFHASCDMS